MGIDINGRSLRNLPNLRKLEFPPAVFVLITFSNENTPPTIGKIPVGSGELRSLNHNIPSVKMAGLIV